MIQKLRSRMKLLGHVDYRACWCSVLFSIQFKKCMILELLVSTSLAPRIYLLNCTLQISI